MEEAAPPVLAPEIFFEKSAGIIEKDLAPRRETHTVSPPFDERPPEKTADGIEGGSVGLRRFFQRKFFENFREKN